MKEYNSPVLQTVELRVEESMSVPLCQGACTQDVLNPDGTVKWYAHGS